MNTIFKHPIERGGKNRVEINIDNYFRNGVIKFDGGEIWRFSSEQEFKDGKEITLPDGSLLAIQLRPSPSSGDPVIYIARNGDPLPKSAFDNQSQYEQSVNFLRIIGGAYLFGGVLSLAQIDGFVTRWTGGSLFSLIAGVLFIGITFVPDDKKKAAYLAGAAIGVAEAVYFFTHPPLDSLAMILRLAAIIMPLACLRVFGDFQRQAAEKAERSRAL